MLALFNECVPDPYIFGGYLLEGSIFAKIHIGKKKL